MNERWEQVKSYVNALSKRERIIVLLVVLVIDFVVIDALWLGGALNERSRLSKQLSSKASANSQTMQQLSEIEAQSQAHLERQADEHKALLKQIERLDGELSEAANGFIPADKMPGVLEDVLRQQKGLTLVSLANLPAVQLAGDQEPIPEKNSGPLYKHGVELKVSGGYHQILQYLIRLESMPWYFHWQALDYQIDRYPAGLLSLKVFTYSTDKEWIGV